MSDFWNTLGLDGPVDDIKLVKKAYAKKLKETRPEEDPEGFMRLRDALNWARDYIAFPGAMQTTSTLQTQQTPADKADIVQPDTLSSHFNKETVPAQVTPVSADFSIENVSQLTEAKDPYVPPADTGPESLIKEIRALLKDPFGRANLNRWKEIFNDERIESIDDVNDFDELFRDFLLDYFGYYSGDTLRSNKETIPRPISKLIGSHIFMQMGWHEIHSRPMYVQDQINWLKSDFDAVKIPSNRAMLEKQYREAGAYEYGSQPKAMHIIWIILGIIFALQITRSIIGT